MHGIENGRLVGRVAMVFCAAWLLGDCGGGNALQMGTGGDSGSGGSAPAAGGSGGGAAGVGGSGGGAGGAGTAGGSGGFREGIGGCFALEELAPIITVVDAATGSPICDPTFTIVAWPDGGTAPPNGAGPIACDGTGNLGCPVSPPDAGPLACTYALAGLELGGGPIFAETFTIEVSKSGFGSVIVPDVVSALGGCVPDFTPAPSKITVSLTPEPGDAAASPD